MTISENVFRIKQRIQVAAQRANRDPAEIRLVAVTKYVTLEQVNEVLQAGITEIGESRVLQAQQKFSELTFQPEKHLIGTLQTNKVKSALETFDLIHSVDRPELVVELSKQAAKLERRVQLLVQVNIAGEMTKHGINPAELDSLLEQIKQDQRLIPMGLMTIAPEVDDPERVRPIFRKLRELFNEIAVKQSFEVWHELSMGMSNDFEVAIEEGASLVRIGTALFASNDHEAEQKKLI